MRKLVFISGLLFAIMFGFSNCVKQSSLNDTLNDTKWQDAVGDGVTIYFTESAFEFTGSFMNVEFPFAKGTYTYEKDGTGTMSFTNVDEDILEEVRSKIDFSVAKDELKIFDYEEIFGDGLGDGKFVKQ